MNIDDVPLDDDGSAKPAGFRSGRARLGPALGCERLGVSLWVLPPGEALCPYHAHLVEEEVALVVAGRPSLREAAGWRELAPGDIVGFPRGADGAHQIVNRGDEEARVLAFSSTGEPEIVLYPDSGKLAADDRRGGLREIFRLADAVGYYEGERPAD